MYGLKRQPSFPFTFDPVRVVAGLRYLTPDFRPGLFTLNPSRVLAGVLAPQRGVISRLRAISRSSGR